MSDEQAGTQVARIEGKIDREKAGAITASLASGGVSFQNMMEVFEFSKLMAVSGAAVPSHLRGNPGACLAICIQALEWKFSPFAVANKSYLVSNKGEERIAFESQLYHAVLETRAPIVGRVQHRYVGEGDERRCIVSATLKGETEPRELISETLGRLRPARNEYGKVKGSPLWETQPDIQLFYHTSRNFARVYFPDVLMGVYTKEELEEAAIGPDNAKDVTPRGTGLVARLAGNTNGDGFRPENVKELDGGTSGAPDELANVAADVPDGQQQPTESAPVSDRQSAGAEPSASGEKSSAPAAEPIDPAEGTRAEAQPEPPKETGPTTTEEYMDYLRAWLVTMDDEAAIQGRFDGEKLLRTKCGVAGKALKDASALKNARMSAVGAPA